MLVVAQFSNASNHASLSKVSRKYHNQLQCEHLIYLVKGQKYMYKNKSKLVKTLGKYFHEYFRQCMIKIYYITFNKISYSKLKFKKMYNPKRIMA